MLAWGKLISTLVQKSVLWQELVWVELAVVGVVVVVAYLVALASLDALVCHL